MYFVLAILHITVIGSTRHARQRLYAKIMLDMSDAYLMSSRDVSVTARTSISSD
jgi:hypothetical protein